MRDFAQLFAGRTDCYGSYQITETRADGKKDGKGTTYSNPGTKVTEAMYRDHLSGKKMLGIVPILPDSTCSWFCLDIDKYDIDHNDLRQRIHAMELPVVLCRSKSGGAHLYCFIDGFIPAQWALDLCKRWANQLGPFQKFDIYPKQGKVDAESLGNWIILPYFGGAKTDRYAYGLEGEALNVEDFVQFANAYCVTPDEVEKLWKTKPQSSAKQDLPSQSPPCIENFFSNKITTGGRNNALCHMAVFYKKVDEDNWKDLLIKFNYDYVDPPLPHEEVQQVIKNSSRKGYAYLCNQMPMLGLCNKELCKSRRYGVGPDKTQYGEYAVQELVKIDSDPPIYMVTINDKKVKMRTDELLNPRNFRKRVMEVCNVLIPLFKQGQHDEIIAPLIADAMIIEFAPEVASLDGQVMSVFREWTKNMIERCKVKDDVAKGHPFYEEETDFIIFRAEDLMKTYRAHYRKDIDMKDLWTALRNMMCETRVTRIKGDPLRAWYYPIAGEEIWFKRPKDDKF